MLQVCIGEVGICKINDAVGTSICRGSADDMGLNPTLDVCLPSLVVVGIFEERTAY